MAGSRLRVKLRRAKEGRGQRAEDGRQKTKRIKKGCSRAAFLIER
jgi:hypothetical protein